MGIFYHVTTAQKQVILAQPDGNISANSGNIMLRWRSKYVSTRVLAQTPLWILAI